MGCCCGVGCLVNVFLFGLAWYLLLGGKCAATGSLILTVQVIYHFVETMSWRTLIPIAKFAYFVATFFIWANLHLHGYTLVAFVLAYSMVIMYFVVVMSYNNREQTYPPMPEKVTRRRIFVFLDGTGNENSWLVKTCQKKQADDPKLLNMIHYDTSHQSGCRPGVTNPCKIWWLLQRNRKSNEATTLTSSYDISSPIGRTVSYESAACIMDFKQDDNNNNNRQKNTKNNKGGGGGGGANSRDVLLYYEGCSTGEVGLGKLWDFVAGRSMVPIAQQAYKKLQHLHEKQPCDPKKDELYIVGFSRGAAASRLLAYMINNYGWNATQADWDVVSPWGFPFSLFTRIAMFFGIKQLAKPEKFPKHAVKIKFLGLFDTVLSSALNVDLSVVPTCVERSAHAVALDEGRISFKPTLNQFGEHTLQFQSDNHKELWFPGGHSNIGGRVTTSQHRIADYTLAWMLHKLMAAGVPELRESCALVQDRVAYCPPSEHDIVQSWEWLPYVTANRRQVPKGAKVDAIVKKRQLFPTGSYSYLEKIGVEFLECARWELTLSPHY